MAINWLDWAAKNSTHFTSFIKNNPFSDEPDTDESVDAPAKEQSKEEVYGCTCTVCKTYNEFAVRKDNHVCYSCKSYARM